MPVKGILLMWLLLYFKAHLVKIHWAIHSLSIYFSIFILYFIKKFSILGIKEAKNEKEAMLADAQKVNELKQIQHSPLFFCQLDMTSCDMPSREQLHPEAVQIPVPNYDDAHRCKILPFSLKVWGRHKNMFSQYGDEGHSAGILFSVWHGLSIYTHILNDLIQFHGFK